MVKDYSKGKVYKIVCRITGQIYIGSTCVELLSHRLRQHKYAYKSYLAGVETSFMTSYKIIEGNDYYIELIENCPCSGNDELTKKEREYYDLFDCINAVRPFVYDHELRADVLVYRERHRNAKLKTDAVYRADHKDKQKILARAWYLKNKELTLERAKINYESNKETVLGRRKINYEENKESIKENRILNKVVLAEKSKIYRDANRDRINTLKLANYHKNKKIKSDTPTI